MIKHEFNELSFHAWMTSLNEVKKVDVDGLIDCIIFSTFCLKHLLGDLVYQLIHQSLVLRISRDRVRIGPVRLHHKNVLVRIQQYNLIPTALQPCPVSVVEIFL